jgi:hypothetical protein
MPTPIDNLTENEAAELVASETLTIRAGVAFQNALVEACKFDCSRPAEDLSAFLALIA